MGLPSQFDPTIGTNLTGALPVPVGLTESLSVALTVLAVIVAYQQIENSGFASGSARRP